MTFQKLLQSGTTAAVLFYGTACPPCARLKPRLIEMAKELNFELVQFNVASEMDTAKSLGIRGVPTLVAVKGGKAEVLFTGEVLDSKIALMLHAAGVLEDKKD
jgi:thioredoxin-like negative regulator of GroEL